MAKNSSCPMEQPFWTKYCDISSVSETCKENLRLQQEKDDLKISFIQSNLNRRYLEYLHKDSKFWPSVKDTGEKLDVARKERLKLKEALEAETDKIKDTLQVINTEFHNLQEKKKLLEDKQKIFESKKAMFESKMKLKPEMAKVAVEKCQQAIVRLEGEIESRTTEMAALDRSISDIQARLRAQRSQQGASSAEQMLQGARTVLKFVESLSGVKVVDIGWDWIEFSFTSASDMEGKRTESSSDDLGLTLTVTFQIRSSDRELQLTGVKTNVDGLKIKDLVDVAIATNDLPYLIHSVKDRWTHHYPLLSEIDILNKTHAIDWIEDQSRLRVLVGKCGRVMFTLSVPQDYPTSSKIVLLDSYGVDNIDENELPDEDATLLQWVTFLETRYGDCE